MLEHHLTQNRRLKLSPSMVLVFGGIVIGLSACGPGLTDSWRYKLTISLDTPDGTKTGVGVVDLGVYCSDFWKGCGWKTHGEAIYIDLGASRRPLVVLLDSAEQLTQRHSKGFQVQEFFPATHRVKGEKQDIEPDRLPDLITFDDVRVPETAITVDPENIAVTLGSGVSWKRITIELTDEPVTSGLTHWLPWATSRQNDGWFVTGAWKKYPNDNGYLRGRELISNDSRPR